MNRKSLASTPEGQEGRLLVNQEKIGIIDQKILSFPPAVKGKIAFGNSLGFQVQIEDLRLKWCIPKKKPKRTISGRTSCLFQKYSASCRF